MRVVKSFVREDYEQKKFNVAAEDVCRDFTKAERILALNNPLTCATASSGLAKNLRRDMFYNKHSPEERHGFINDEYQSESQKRYNKQEYPCHFPTHDKRHNKSKDYHSELLI